MLRYQSRLDFDGIHKTYHNYDTKTFSKNGVKMERPIYLGFAILELSKLSLYETKYDKLQKNFGQEGLQLHFQDTDAFAMSIKIKDVVKDLDELQEQFEYLVLVI